MFIKQKHIIQDFFNKYHVIMQIQSHRHSRFVFIEAYAI